MLRKGLHPVKKAPTITFKGSDLPPATTTPQPPQTAKSSESEDEDYPLVTTTTYQLLAHFTRCLKTGRVNPLYIYWSLKIFIYL